MPVDPRCVKELFNAALDLPQAADRAAFLDRECAGDRELRLRLDVLIAAHDAPASELERPLAAKLEGFPVSSTGETAAASESLSGGGDPTRSPRAEDSEPASLIGTIIAGRFKVRQEIGEGGMGSVYLAEQTHPVKRQVALKLVKPGMDSKTVLARFESERQALAPAGPPPHRQGLRRRHDRGGTPLLRHGARQGYPSH